MNTITYRFANLSDVKKLSILFKQVYIQTYGFEGVSDEFANFITVKFSEENISKKITEQPESILVADYKTNLVGVAELEFNQKSPVGEITGTELSKLYILEWFTGKGVGKELLHFTEALLHNKKIDNLWLWVLDSNERAIEFYKKNGFQTIGKALFKMEVNTYDNFVMYKSIP